MKFVKLALLTLSIALASVSNAAITYGGPALKNVQGTTAVDLVAGRLGLLIVDTDGDGFLTGFTGGKSPAAGNPFSPSGVYSTSGAGLAVGSTFGGDLVVARLNTAVQFGDTNMNGTLTGFTATPYLNKNYAIVWFDTLTTAGTETVAPVGTYFGIARGGDWSFPPANNGSFAFGTGTTNLDQITLAAGGSANAATVPAGQSVAFATAGTSLQFLRFDIINASIDTDTDGIDDLAETNTGIYVSSTNTGTNPNSADPDGDLFGDGYEVAKHSNPSSATSKPNSKLQVRTSFDTNALGIGSASNLAVSGGRVATWERTGNGKVHLLSINSQGDLAKTHEINSPDTSYDLPGFGLGLALSGDRLLIGNYVTWINAPHDGRAYKYDLSNGSPALQKVFSEGASVASYIGINVFASPHYSFIGAGGNPQYGTHSDLKIWHENPESLVKSVSSTITGHPHISVNQSETIMSRLIPNGYDYNNCLLEQYSLAGAEVNLLRSTSFGLSANSMMIGVDGHNPKRIASIGDNTVVLDGSKIICMTPAGAGFSRSEINLNSILSANNFECQTIAYCANDK